MSDVTKKDLEKQIENQKDTIDALTRELDAEADATDFFVQKYEEVADERNHLAEGYDRLSAYVEWAFGDYEREIEELVEQVEHFETRSVVEFAEKHLAAETSE